MNISIIIVNYNTQELTLQCLQSVFEKTTGITFEVIVVDNASADNSVVRIKTEFPQVILIESAENLGFGRANNLGFEYSSGEYIFLLNSDTILMNNAIEILSHFLNENSQIAIVGGQLYEADGITKGHSYSLLFPSIFMEIDILFREWFSHRMDQKRLKHSANKKWMNVAYITGADMMLRRTDIQKFGMFDPSFFLYFEETELCYRFKENGRKSAIVSDAKIIHLAGGSFSLAKARSKFFIEGRKNYYKITHSKPYNILVDLIWRITFISVVLQNSTKSDKRKEWIVKVRSWIDQIIK